MEVHSSSLSRINISFCTTLIKRLIGAVIIDARVLKWLKCLEKLSLETLRRLAGGAIEICGYADFVLC